MSYLMEITEELRKKIEVVEDAVTEYLGTDRESLHKGWGDEANCNAKCMVWYIIHYKLNVSLSAMSKEYGRSRRQIFRAIAKIKNGLEMQPYYKNMYGNIMNMIKEIP